MKKKLALASFQLKNFKAVQDSKTIKFTPLTALIGNNGSGKSSIVEALDTFQTLALEGLDAAMQPWHGFEHIWNQTKEHKLVKRGKAEYISNPMSFILLGMSKEQAFRPQIEVVADSNLDKVFFQRYRAAYASGAFEDRPGHIAGNKITDPYLTAFVQDWQFLCLVPQSMTEPIPQKRSYGAVRLDKSGSNIAEYLQEIRDKDLKAFNGIIEALKVVLPYAVDLQPAITSELERKVYLTFSEQNISKKLAGWLLSTGTLRILALLALLRDPEPSPVIVIEEIENGLDPRTVHVLVDEIRDFVTSGRGQIILTTHSPYLLDLMKLSQIIVVDRQGGDSPRFRRPASEKELVKWANQFSPGKLYTMGRLTGPS